MGAFWAPFGRVLRASWSLFGSTWALHGHYFSRSFEFFSHLTSCCTFLAIVGPHDGPKTGFGEVWGSVWGGFGEDLGKVLDRFGEILGRASGDS